jgi:uncharacterized protein
MEKNALDWVSCILVIIGGLNWGLIAAGNWNVVNMLLGSVPMVERIVYGLVGLAALYMIYGCYKRSQQ